MRIYFAFALALVATLVSAADLNEVASFPDQQVTGVGVSTKSGRIFVKFPLLVGSALHFGRRNRKRPAETIPERRVEQARPSSAFRVCAERCRG
jgi:hypothetical protein